MATDIPFEWFMLLLRVVFIFLLYFFVFQVIRVLSQELRGAAGAAAGQRHAAPTPYGALRVEEGGESNLYPGQMLQLEPVTVIGRDRRATISLDHSFISSEHTQISWEGGQWWASDLRSTNGTYVNGNKITVSTALQPGDQIDIGDITLRLVQ